MQHHASRWFFAVVLLSFFFCARVFATGTVCITDYGAKGDGQSLNTKEINRALEACAEQGGGTVVIPEGVFLSGTLHMKSDVSLRLEKGAVLRGVSDKDAYFPYVPLREREGADPGHYRWSRALILGVGVTNVSIYGEGTIDGTHIFDPEGEEKMRGPHIVFFGESNNITLTGITFNRASNYAFMARHIENAVFRNLTFNEGWDGIHIRHGKNITIRNSVFRTGDDAIAGGYWENAVITDCEINSSCNGIRIIMPVDDLTIRNCRIHGPGVYPHRTSKEKNRTNTLTGILIQPGGWGKAPGKVDRVHIHDIEIENVDNPLMFVLHEGNHAGKIVVEKIKASRINRFAFSIESWKGGVYENVTLRDVEIDYIGNPEAFTGDYNLKSPPTDARPLPVWGLFVRNVKEIELENVNLRHTESDPRPAMHFDNVATARLKNVTYTENKDTENIIWKNSGERIVDGNSVSTR